MVENKIYKDISTRTNGDIYIGVVGPVRTGKSSFITKFMNKMVLPTMEDDDNKKRIIDELPQSSDGKVIMTTQPKFVPDGGVKINISDNANINIRLIDCVGYPYPGAQGFMEDDKERMVLTPWAKEEMKFTQAAKLGTQKVINDHSTIGVVVTNDGSIVGIKRDNFLKEEKEIVENMKLLNKPFIVLLNSKNPNEPKTTKLREEMEKEYNVPVVVKNIQNMEVEDFEEVMQKVLSQFPLKSIDVIMPSYLQALKKDSEIINHIMNCFLEKVESIKSMDECNSLKDLFNDDEYMLSSNNIEMDYGKGKASIILNPRPELFYKVLSEECGENIEDEFKLVSYIKDLAIAKKEYMKLKSALEDVEEYGYGIVTPQEEDLVLDPPEIVKKGNKCAVKLRAQAPSYHIMKVDVETEVNPIFGGQSQNEEMVREWIEDFEDANAIWKTNMFGKSLEQLAKEGLSTKIQSIGEDVQYKMRRALGRIINEGKGGIICILL